MEKEALERLEFINKRIDDNRAYVATIISSAAGILALLIIVFTWNLNTEKNELKEFRTQLKEEVNTLLGKTKNHPKINLYSRNGDDLLGDVINVNVEIDENEELAVIAVPIVLKNDGKAPTGEVTIKLYTKKGIQLWEKTTFEKHYTYETYWQGKEDSGIPNMPGGGFAQPYHLNIWPENAGQINLGKHDVKVEIYYGNNLVTDAEFRVYIEKNLIAEPAK